jgi:transposase-like protein
MRLAEGHVMTDTSMVPRKREDGPPSRPPLVDQELADQLLGKAQAEGVELLGPDGLLSRVTKAVLERALAEEMTGQLGYEKHDPAGRGSGNSRNGSTPKTLLTDVGAVDLAVPRDRNGSFEPKIVRRGQIRPDGFNERIIALYARGMTTRDIRAHLREMYGVEVSADLISRVTDAVVDELAEWQSRPLDAVYPVAFIDALMVKIRDGVVTNRAVYLAIGIDCEGHKQVLGLWVGPTTGESAKFWLTVLAELKSRGVADVCIVCCDELTGLPDAISVVWPQAVVQLRVVHLIRASLRYAFRKYWAPLTKDLRPVYAAAHEQAAAMALEASAAVREQRYPAIVKLWRAHWAEFTPVPGVPARGPPGDLHHEPDRVDERPAAQGDPQPRAVPLRTGCPQGPLPRRAQPGGLPGSEHGHPKFRLETGAAGVHDLLRRMNPNPMTATLTYTDGRTLPDGAITLPTSHVWA